MEMIVTEATVPLYEYECSGCHHRFERIEPVTAPNPQPCPRCGSPAERRLAPPALQFKGSGWYITDYARKSTSTSESKSSGEDSGGKKDSGES